MRSYLKFLSRNKLYTAIEAVGLAVSLAFDDLLKRMEELRERFRAIGHSE